MSFGYQILGFGSGGSAQFLEATGGNATVTCGSFKTHIFTGPGTFCVSTVADDTDNNQVDYLVVGGGGGAWANPTANAGGGGAGGFRMSNELGLPSPATSPIANSTGLTVSASPYSITVGAGATNVSCTGVAPNGSASTFDSITSAGGGGGRDSIGVGGSGASGGGGSQGPTPTSGYPGGAGNTPPVSPSQGNPGGAGYDGKSATCNGGGGGGGGAAGGNAGPGQGGAGGVGSYIGDGFVGPTAPSYGTPGPVSSTRYLAGGAGGASWAPGTPGNGGAGGGGKPNGPTTPGTSGTVNTGGGSGSYTTGGGSGIVMIRYRFK